MTAVVEHDSYTYGLHLRTPCIYKMMVRNAIQFRSVAKKLLAVESISNKKDKIKNCITEKNWLIKLCFLFTKVQTKALIWHPHVQRQQMHIY